MATLLERIEAAEEELEKSGRFADPKRPRMRYSARRWCLSARNVSPTYLGSLKSRLHDDPNTTAELDKLEALEDAAGFPRGRLTADIVAAPPTPAVPTAIHVVEELVRARGVRPREAARVVGELLFAERITVTEARLLSEASIMLELRPNDDMPEPLLTVIRRDPMAWSPRTKRLAAAFSPSTAPGEAIENEADALDWLTRTENEDPGRDPPPGEGDVRRPPAGKKRTRRPN